MISFLESPGGLSLISSLVALASAGGAASLINPAVRKFIMPERRFDRLRDHILFSRPLRDGMTIRTSDGGLFITLAIQGRDLAAIDEGTAETLYSARQSWLNKMSGMNVLVRTFSVRRLHDYSVFGENIFYDNAFLSKMHGNWAERFTNAYRNQHYVVLSIKGGSERAERILNKAAEVTLGELAEYRPRLMTVDDNGKGDQTNLSFWAGLLNPGLNAEVSIPAEAYAPLEVRDGRTAMPLNASLADVLVKSRVLFHDGRKERQDNGLVEFQHGSDRIYMRGVSLSTWGQRTSAAVLSSLMSIDAEVVVAQMADVLDATDAERYLKNKGKAKLGAAEHGGIFVGRSVMRAKEEFDLAIDEVTKQGNGQALVKMQFTVFVFARSKTHMAEAIKQVETVFRYFDMKCHHLAGEIEPLYFSMFPPHYPNPDKDWACRTDVLAGNAADVMSFETPSQGLDRCDWGNHPVTLFPTLSGSPYGFTFHPKPDALAAAHTLVIGDTGAGKTVTTNFILSAAMSFPDLHLFILDRDDGSYVPTKILGGRYFQTQTSVDTVGDVCRLNPLQMPDDRGGREFKLAWLRDNVTGIPEDDTVGEMALSQALDGLAEVDIRDKNINTLLTAIPTHLPVYTALSRWAKGGNYGHLFNGATDTLDINAGRLIGFDFSRILEDPVLVGALLPYLSYRISTEMRRHGAPWVMFVDELRALMRNGNFVKILEQSLLEARKSRGTLVLGTQTVASLYENGESSAQIVIGSCQTQLVFPNPRARVGDFERLGLSPQEEALIRLEDPRVKHLRNRWFMLRRPGEGSVILNVDLSPLGDTLFFLESGNDPASILRKLEATYHNDMGLVVPEYVKAWKNFLANKK